LQVEAVEHKLQVAPELRAVMVAVVAQPAPVLWVLAVMVQKTLQVEEAGAEDIMVAVVAQEAQAAAEAVISPLRLRTLRQ
jgi:hypothetical protein